MSSLEGVRQKLLQPRYAKRIEKTLAFWALPKDRRLPYALLGQQVRQILVTPYDELAATPGIGRKKIASLVMLLRRVLSQELVDSSAEPEEPTCAGGLQDGAAFDPGRVSESLWAQWCAAIRRAGLEQEKLGRLAPSLRMLPTLMWDTPLSTYLSLPVHEIRSMKTYGDKRVRVVLEVFHAVHQLVGAAQGHWPLVLRLLPRFVLPLESWIVEQLSSSGAPDVQDIRQNLALPLLNQIERDAGETVHRLAAGRLGIEGRPETAREQARRLEVTRARVYQLLEICGRVMAVRWPEGRWQLAAFGQKFAPLPPHDERRYFFSELQALMFPGRTIAARREPAAVKPVRPPEFAATESL